MKFGWLIGCIMRNIFLEKSDLGPTVVAVKLTNYSLIFVEYTSQLLKTARSFADKLI